MTPSSAPLPGLDASGLPAERTDLAWSRSGLALLACFALLARRVWGRDVGEPTHALALVLLAAGAFVWALGFLWVRGRGVPRRTLGSISSHRRYLLATIGTVVLAVAGVVATFLPPLD